MEFFDKKSFDILLAISNCDSRPTQRKIATITGYSMGSVNFCLKKLKEGLFIDLNDNLTQKSLEILENYRVKRAVFIAAGFGSRLVPITLNTPKPLVRVKGVRIIDTAIDALVAQDIKEIYVVRGYLKEQFDQLLYKYPFVKFIDNPLYNQTNNISSALVASDYLQNAYVLEADLLVNNPSIITKYQYSSNVLGMKKKKSDDWCLTIKNGFISSEVVGGVNLHQEVGITYLSAKDGEKAKYDIKRAYDMPGGKELFWEQTFFKVFNDDYHFSVRECNEGDVVEIDTFEELKLIDKSYDI